ncbi:MAG: NADH dehydrogenase FAD-containing subunit [Phycisphaerae bacterium]|nr:NADH dehydrogenase FAD-containing subunit [Phycisphaerae bacterium]
MFWAVILIPAVAGALALVSSGNALRRCLLIVGALGHTVAVGLLCATTSTVHLDAWIGLDEAGKLFLCITSGLFLTVAMYTAGYLRREFGQATRDTEEGFLFRNEPEAIFVGCLLLFLATMSLVCVSRHMGLLWVAVEATTLASAPLISFHRHHRSLEATWKYLLICSVGIALALLGNFFLAYAGRGHISHLSMHDLLAEAKALNPAWLKAAFLMLLVGYGTKMGLAPMHTWLPDAHSEAPSMISALLSGALLNCAFLGILRSHAILTAAGLGHFSGELLVLFGLLSMGVAAVFLIHQTDYKRMLAYSSVEHMGILAMGVGIGGLAATGAMLHAINHSFAKGMFFLTAGNLLTRYRTKQVNGVRGVLRSYPVTGCLWLAGFFAIAGSPPFGLFVSEFTILKGALESGRWYIAAGYLLALGVIFVAMARLVLPMAFGRAESTLDSKEVLPVNHKEAAWTVVPPLAMGGVVLVLGVYVPPALWDFLQAVAAGIGVRR